MAQTESSEPGHPAGIETADRSAGAGPTARLALNSAAAAGASNVSAARQVLESGTLALEQRFLSGDSVEILVRDRAALVDAVLEWSWHRLLGDHRDAFSLVAVGGYGRGELHPSSDVDVMILLPGDADDLPSDALEAFVAFLWDTGLEIGHSVRTLDDCVAQAGADITVTTSLMESRLVAGHRDLFERMRARTGPEHIWPSRAFFEAKREEQIQRHHRYHDTAYNLEPNVKGSPGGLRDIQMIGWVAQRHFGAETLHQLISHGFLTEHEYRSLLQGRAFLWKLRYALHIVTGRKEDRLLFDHQIRLAEMFGFEDAAFTLAVEQMMQRYYRTVMKLSRLNEMLLQLFEEAILLDPDASPAPLDEHFVSINGYLAARDDKVFIRHPRAMLGLFRTMQSNLHLRGVSAQTIRLVRRHRHLIDEQFRQDPAHHRLFLELIRAKDGVTRALTMMNRYGVLGRYLPAFGRIVGRMQYDLFHAYTVDAHTLFVINNLRRFSLSRFNREFPYCSQIMQSLDKPELAYLAGLFHDIAKGRGGDHSELGAVDAEAFCLEHGLGDYESRLVAWLVRHHLVLSTTAQKQDISDPRVIQNFARLVGDQTHLDYLYVLTVADVRATNPSLWTSWKASLFEEFYRQVRSALVRGPDNLPGPRELSEATRQATREMLLASGLDDQAVDRVWEHFDTQHFQRHRPEDIAWHTRVFAEKLSEGVIAPFVAVRQKTDRGVTAVLVHMSEGTKSFAEATAVLDELGLNILNAEISTTRDGFSLDSYHVTEATGDPIADAGRADEIRKAVHNRVVDGNSRMTSRRRPSRQLRSFKTLTRIRFSEDPDNRRTIMELDCGDRPGLLSQIGQVLVKGGIQLQAARITTVGERAEDVFFITDNSRQAIPRPACEALAEALHKRLDQNPDEEKPLES